MKLKTISILGCILFLHLSRASGQSNALSFDGSNDYVQLASQINVGSDNFTFEAWVRPATTSNGIVFAQDVSGDANHMFRLAVQSTRAYFYFRGATTNPNIQISTLSGTVPTNQWTHLAVVRNSGQVSIYVNGVEEATGSTSVINNQSGADASKRFRIGARGGTAHTSGQNNFQGSIDNFRYWNIARTAADIKSYLFHPPSAASSGLVIWYNLDAGSGTTAINSAPGGNNATLINGPSWVASPLVYNQNAIDLDGTNDDVEIGTVLPTGSSFTKEAWVYATATSGTRSILSSLTGPLWISNGQLKAGVGGNLDAVTDPASFPVNTWVHIAVTFDNPSNTIRLYRNGTLVASNTSVTNNYLGEAMHIGSWLGALFFFDGRMDEVRIWNTARSAAEIQNGMNMEISPASEANLVAYYTFNQGHVSGTNTGLNVVVDQKGTFNGSISSLSLTGSSSNFVAQFASLAVLPLVWKEFTATRKGNAIHLTWVTEDEENTQWFVVQHSDDNVNWKEVAWVGARGENGRATSYHYMHGTPSARVNYYRIMEKDRDGKTAYSEIRKVLSESNQNYFTVINNPVVNGTLELQVHDAATFTLRSIQGNVILKKQLLPGIQRLNVSHLSKGIYIAQAGQTIAKIVLK